MTSEGLANPRRLSTRFLHLSLSICRTVRAFFSSRLAVRTSAAIWKTHTHAPWNHATMKLNLQVSRFSHSRLKISNGLCRVSAPCCMRSCLLSHRLSQWWNGNICVICRDIFIRPLISFYVYHRHLPLLLITKSNLGAKADNTDTKILLEVRSFSCLNECAHVRSRRSTFLQL